MPKVVRGGSRLVFNTRKGNFPLRTLEDTELGDEWAIPVIADTAAVAARTGDVDVPTDDGLVHVRGELRAEGGGLALHPVGEEERVQRRQDVRWSLELPVRAGLPPASAPAVQVPRVADGVAFVPGVTLDVSAGGLHAQLQAPARLAQGSNVYVELHLPNGVLAPAVVSVVQQYGQSLRGRFVEIAPQDRETLARLIFARQREEIAARRALREGTPLTRRR